MIGFLEGLKVTLKTAGRKPVTAEYPEPQKRLAVQDRYMGFPALLWDGDVPEPYCTGCMVCIRNCPTQCMSAQMTDNPKHAEGTSRRRKIISEFEINLGRCILCGICVDVCNFDAIEMSHEHELSKYERNGNRADLPKLLEMGQEYQAKTGWKPTQPEKNSGVPVQKPTPSAAPAAPAAAMSKEERLAAARARAVAKRQGEEAGAVAPAAAMSKEERLAAARARAVAKRQGEEAGAVAPAAAMSKEERLAAARARAAAKRQGEEAGTAAPAAAMSKEERLAAARARAAAKRQAQEAQESDSS
jgi:NADH-quinone oxidoreductase subunit I